MSTVKGSPVFRQTLQLPSSVLMTYMTLALGTVLEVMLGLGEQEQDANQLEVTMWLVDSGNEKCSEVPVNLKSGHEKRLSR